MSRSGLALFSEQPTLCPPLFLRVFEKVNDSGHPVGDFLHWVFGLCLKIVVESESSCAASAAAAPAFPIFKVELELNLFN